MPSWKRAPIVEALQALKGVSFVTAMTLVAEVGSFSRFGNPKQLMAFLGLVPTANPRISAGSIVEERGAAENGDQKRQLTEPAISAGADNCAKR